ncbi:MAG: anhydro-N-acetylmuramic acid kinase [Planctomycetes bacterium]|nr:anhydro-N-acetylmuramic acid kinase [Planctomycetota bacterium]
MRTRHIVGCMTGTSMDAIDAALVRVEGTGLAMRATPVRYSSHPLGELSVRLRGLANQSPMSAGQIAGLARDFSLAHVPVLRELLANRPQTDLIVVHGQTVYHAPPVSWQLLTPAVIAHELRTPVLSDLRAGDLAAGGQGAPITPLADYVLLRSETESLAVLNLGGFANYTWLPRADGGDSADMHDHARFVEQVRGGDICVCNQLLNSLAQALLDQPFDADGATATRGDVIDRLRDVMIERLDRQRRSGRSLGTTDESLDWLAATRTEQPADVLASACDAIAHVIAAALPKADRILLAGGGAMNSALVRRIAAAAGTPCTPLASVGMPASHREAIEMAVLGALCQDGVPITLPEVTGRTSPLTVSGCWTLPT